MAPTSAEERKEKRESMDVAWKKARAEEKRATAAAKTKANREKRSVNAKAAYKTYPERAREQARAWRKANPERFRAHTEAWKKANPEKVRASRLAKYGLSVEEFDRMNTSQGGKCAACLRECSQNKRLSVDHDHLTGRVRGLLCARCNAALGQCRDNPEILLRLSLYAETHR